jgi:hypothetical protein
MKKLILFLGILMVSLSSFGQLTISQSLSPTTGLKVGDTVTVKYTLSKGQVIKNPRYIWFRYHYNNKALAYVSTAFNQGTSAQTFYTGWNNYTFNFNGGASDNDLDVQYGLTPWNYTVNNDWNVGQLTIQRADASISGLMATQKYILKDQNTYNNIFKLDLATGTDTAGAAVGTIYGGGWTTITGVTGNTSQFKVRALFPSTYTTITDHSVQLMKLKTDGSGMIDWTQQPIAVAPLDASGEAIFTTQVKVGDSLGVFIGPAFQKTWMNNIITVSDAYKAFLGVAQTDISGTANFFTYPTLEKKVGLITKNKSTFSESDSYYMFAKVMGINVDSNAMLPSSASTSVRWYSGLLNQSWLDGTPTNKVTITQPIQAVDAVFAWGGDLDWSHSSSPTEIASRVTSGNYANSINPAITTMNRVASMSTAPMAYASQTLETAKLSVTSTLEGGKVILTANLTKEGLAGLQVIMNYDESKLTLDNVIFDAGSTITNFSTHDNGRLTFGSIDQQKTARIKTGIPYKLIFTPKTPLTNTAGLFYFVLADAVDGSGNKINLIID